MAETGELAGRLRERVTVEQWRESRDAAGLSVGAWENVAVLAADVALDRVVNADLLVGDAEQTAARWRVTLRAPVAIGVTIGVTSRLWWRGERLAVLAVERDPGLPDRVVVRCRSAG